MHSIAQAMFWECLRKCRWSLIPFVILAMAIWIIPLSSKGFDRIDLKNAEFVLMHFVFSLITIMCIIGGAFPFQSPVTRYYTLPISTKILVVWKIFLPSLVVACVIASLFAVINAVYWLDLPILTVSLFAFTFSVPFFFACIQNSTYSLWSLFGGLTVMVGLAQWARSRYGDLDSIPTHLWREVTISDFVTMLVTTVVLYAIAVQLVQADRCGEPWIPRYISQWLRGFRRNSLTSLRASLPAFSFPAEAQFWYEYQQKGKAFPAAVVLVLSMYFFPFAIFVAIYGFKSIEELSSFPVAIEAIYHGIEVLGLLFSIFAFFAGIFVGCSDFSGGKRQQDPSLGELVNRNELIRMGAFQGTLPIVPMQFAMAIYRTILQSLFLTWIVWLVLFAVAGILLRFVHPDVNSLQLPFSGLGYWGVPITLLGPWAVMSNVASIGLTGRNWLVFSFFLVTVSMPVSIPIVGDVLTTIFAMNEELLLNRCLGLQSLGVILGTVYAFAQAARRKLVGLQSVAVGVMIASLIVAMAILFTPWELNTLAYLMILGFAALVVLPLATIPLAIAWNRHR